MNNLDKQYQSLLQDILDNGVQKSDRTGTGTISVFGRQIRHKMSEGFPLLTTKKMYMKGIVTELLWFLRGDTNIKYLVDNDCHIWDGDAYKNYFNKTKDLTKDDFEAKGNGVIVIKGFDLKSINQYGNISGTISNSYFIPYTQEEFINKIKTDHVFAKQWGDLGPVYGRQWRSWKTYKHKINYEPYLPVNKDGKVECYVEYVDQIANSLNLLKTDPDSRRNKVSAWNVGEMNQMTLPPCHTDFQFYTRELSAKERWDWYGKNGGPMGETKLVALMVYENEEDNSHIHSWLKTWAPNVPTRAISLMWNQRSVDTFLGLPFNIASYGLLLLMLAKRVNMVPDELIGNLGDVHLYSNHIEQAKEQLTRELMKLPNIELDFEYTYYDGYITEFDKIDRNSIKLVNYESHPEIKAPLSN